MALKTVVLSTLIGPSYNIPLVVEGAVPSRVYRIFAPSVELVISRLNDSS